MTKKGISKFPYMILLLIFACGLAISCDGENVLTVGPEMPGPEEPGPEEPGPEEPGGSEFNAETAAELMYLCLQSYQMLIDNDNGKQFTLPSPYDLQEILLTPEGFFGESLPEAVPIAFIATSGSNIYVVFRGTKTIDEWISDADFPLVNYAYGGQTEQGFTDIYNTLAVTSAVTSAAESGNYNNVYITGHSLGAALAVLAVADIIENTDFKNPVMYNFAGPRAGDAAFKSVYEGYGIDSWRVYNTNDIVPTLPPTELSYVHVDTGYSITFGAPITGPTDFHQIAINHSSCNYYSTVCGLTSDQSSCEALGEGLDDCTFNSGQ